MKLLTVAFFLSLAFSASAAPRPSCLEECRDGNRIGCLKKAKEGTRVEDWYCDEEGCSRKKVLYDVTEGTIPEAKQQMRDWCDSEGMQ